MNADSQSPPTGPAPYWFSARTEQERREYAERFRTLAEDGQDVDGEARFVDALAARGSTVLDAGCGVGRVAAALARAGHQAVGVDADPLLIARGRELHPGLPLAVLDLTALDAEALTARGLPTSYDVVVCAGNVLHYVAPGTQGRVLAALAAVLRPGGRAAFGFGTGRDYTHDLLDSDAGAAGLVREHRFADWELRPDRTGADWGVAVFTRPVD